MLVKIPENIWIDRHTVLPREVFLKALRRAEFIPVRLENNTVGTAKYYNDEEMEFEVPPEVTVGSLRPAPEDTRGP